MPSIVPGFSPCYPRKIRAEAAHSGGAIRPHRRGDGGHIQSGTIIVFSYIVDAQLAKEAIAAALRKKCLLKGAVMVVDKNHWFELLWQKIRRLP